MAKKRKPPTPTVQDYVNLLALRGYKTHLSIWRHARPNMWMARIEEPYESVAIRGTQLSAVRALWRFVSDDYPANY